MSNDPDCPRVAPAEVLGVAAITLVLQAAWERGRGWLLALIAAPTADMWTEYLSSLAATVN